jgi:hypothetical protein
MSGIAATLGQIGTTFAMFASPIAYARPSGGMVTLPGFGHALFGAELVAAAEQYTDVITVRKADLAAAGLYPPQRFDRITIDGRTYSVETWRTSPATGNPVFVRLNAKGGQV